MAVYKRLSLTAGGGIVSTKQQAEQAKNTATLLIGLGGTGTDCLRTIKTQVRTRLKPDDPEAIVPTYSHIRFLGVDTDESRGDSRNDAEAMNTGSKMALDETEYFSIANRHIDRALQNVRSIKQRKELAWLRYEDIDATKMGDRGAGGLRQVGRLMMMDRSNEFMGRVRDEIRAARTDLMSPTVNVHIFSGLSGGTGAGCFLDVCYMVKSIAAEVGGVNVYGYFFLPDVNACKVPTDNKFVHEYLPKNGYAALQELDYCMQLQYNGGAFTQEYKGGKRIEWKSAPVDMCHLVCATNSNDDAISNPYDYAMNVTAEYVMDFLTNSIDEKFKLTSHLSNFKTVVSQADSVKTFGSEMSYIAIGASCASIPMREINTYLASELFDRFARVGGNVPSKVDVERLAARAFGEAGGNVDDVYESLLRQIREKAGGDFRTFRHDWRFVRDEGNGKLVRNYADQMAEQVGNVVANAANMKGNHNEGSLLMRVAKQLEVVIRDVDRGPVYAHRMLDAAESFNLVNVVDGLIAQNTERWNHESYQSDLRNSDYEAAKADFEAHQNAFLGIGCRRRFEAYEWCLCQLYLHKLNLRIYEEMDGVLTKLRSQLVRRDAGYYLRLARVTQNLIDTFAENRRALQSEKAVLDSTGGFAEPMMSIAELKPALDAEVKRVDVPNMLDAFMDTLLSNEDEWLPEDEGHIARLVNRFFVERAFSDFAGRTITRFLSDKYNTTTDEELANHVYRDWISRLTKKASPLFSFDPSVWDESRTSKMAFVSVPAASGPIKAAAQRIYGVNDLWQMKESDLNDRIYVMCSAAALPLSSYSKRSECENKYYGEVFAKTAAGRHSYEGKPVEGMAFDDWRFLPSLTPQSHIETSRVNWNLGKLVDEQRMLFKNAIETGIIDPSGQIMELDGASVERVKVVIGEARSLAASMSSRTQIPQAEGLLARLRMEGRVGLVPSGDSLKLDGKADSENEVLRVLEDHFVYAPPFHMRVREAVEIAKQIALEAEEAGTALNDAIERIDSPDLDNFMDALLSGVITINGFQVSFERDEFGIKSQELLSSRDRSLFPFCSIPPYQAFLSYQKLDVQDKKDMADRANKRFNNDYDQVAALAVTLKKEISENKIQAWSQFARQQANRAELMEFIGNLKQRFETHCLEFGVR